MRNLYSTNVFIYLGKNTIEFGEKVKMGLKPLASDPLQQKQLLAFYTSSQLSRGATESVEEYNERIRQYREELNERLRTQNTELLRNKIAGIDPTVSSNKEKLENAYSQIDSLKFWQYALDNYDTEIVDAQIERLKRQQNVIKQRIEELEKGKNDGKRLNLYEQDTSDYADSKVVGMFDNDVLATGQRNILG